MPRSTEEFFVAHIPQNQIENWSESPAVSMNQQRLDPVSGLSYNARPVTGAKPDGAGLCVLALKGV